MNKNLLYTLVIFSLSASAYAQVGINSSEPKATIDIQATNIDASTAEGIIAPRLTGDQIKAKDAQYGTDQVGTLIYASAAVTSTLSGKTINIDSAGYYFFDGTLWLKVASAADDSNLATTNLTQDAETRTYDLNNQDLNFTNGSFGINKANPSGRLDVVGTENEDAFRFVQTNNLTGEKDVFTIEDQDVGGGSQDGSSVLKILKSGSINNNDNGFSLIELANTSTDPGNNKYWISGRKVDEGAPLWGVDITDSDYWSEGGIQLGVNTNNDGSYSGGNFRVNANGTVGVGTITPNASASVDLADNDKGLLVNRVALTSRGVNAPINSPAVGLLIYNTNTQGVDFNKVIPGFYFWDGSRWNPLKKSFSTKFIQSDEVVAANSLGTYKNITGLNQSFTAPETGKYQIIVNGNYASGGLVNTEFIRNFTANSITYTTGNPVQNVTSHTHRVTVAPETPIRQLQQGFGEASFKLSMDSATLGERIVVANSIAVFDPNTNITTNNFALGESTQIITNVNLIAGNTYQLNVEGKEWSRVNTLPGKFGANTSGFSNSSGENNALRCELIINFVE